MKLRKTPAVSATAVLLLAGCSSDDDASPGDGAADVQVDDVKDGDTLDLSDLPEMPDGPTGSASSELVVDAETIELSGGRCVLEEQDAVVGDGKILFTGQATGVNGDGEEIMLDVTRYDADSIFEGDAIDLVIGDYRDPDVRTYSLGIMGIMSDEKEDHLALDGSTISADDVELTDDDLEEQPVVSFEINC